jgi:hypothetical protein
MKTRIVGFACAALLCEGLAPAAADPVAIRSGSISTDFTDVGATLHSEAFSLSLIGFGETLRMPDAVGFHAGESVDFSAIVNGPFHTNPGGETKVLDLNLLAEPVIVTATPSPFGTMSIHLQTPFTMTGTVAGTEVTGAGTLFLRGGSESGETPQLLGIDEADFLFSSSSSPTPEPASVVLLGTALAAIARRIGRRQRDGS